MRGPYRDGWVRAGPSRLRWRLARVRGQSMHPTLDEGDLLLVDHRAPVTPGRLVVVRLPDRTPAVKRAWRREPQGWWVERDNPRTGVDSWSLGAVADADVLGVVTARLWPRPGPL